MITLEHAKTIASELGLASLTANPTIVNPLVAWGKPITGRRIGNTKGDTVHHNRIPFTS